MSPRPSRDSNTSASTRPPYFILGRAITLDIYIYSIDLPILMSYVFLPISGNFKAAEKLPFLATSDTKENGNLL